MSEAGVAVIVGVLAGFATWLLLYWLTEIRPINNTKQEEEDA